jgi:hypothetical protein
MTVSRGGYIIPDAIRDKFTKWEVHIPLTYLTDSFCSSQHATQSSLSNFLVVIDGQLTTKSKSLSPVSKLDMSFDEWHQAWQHLLKLIEQYHADELPLWQTHYSSIMVNETQGEDWPLWLAYDMEVRHCSVTTPLNPSKFQQRLFDNLYICYTGKRSYHNFNPHLPSVLCPITPPPPLISIHINTYQIADTPTTLVAIPFTLQTPT